MRACAGTLVMALVGGVACSTTSARGVSDGAPLATLQRAEPTREWRNGRWFDGQQFASRTVWTVGARLTTHRPATVDSVVELAGRFVVPPFGEAHNHNAVPSDTGIVRRYLAEGIFYVANPNNLPRDRATANGLFNRPGSIDVAFSNGGLTGPGGHPIDLVRRNIARGVWTPEAGEGAFYVTLASATDLEAKWPAILATGPDFIKTYLLHSDAYEARLRDTATFGWRGLDPALLPLVVQRARTAGLRVTTHVESAADFRVAVRAGVSVINHLPGFRPDLGAPGGYADLSRYRLSEADAGEAARRGVTVVTTVSETLEVLERMRWPPGRGGQEATAVRTMLLDNLRVLRDAGVTIALGSDRYRGSSALEVTALRGARLFSDTALLRMWSMDTPRAIFPDRHVGALDEDAEGSFLVLEGDPLADFANVRRISLRVKDGRVLPAMPPAP